MMNGTAIREIRELAVEAAEAETLVEAGGLTYSKRKLFPIPNPTLPEKDDIPSPFKVSTLSGIVDYLTSNVDGLKAEEIAVHVSDALSVEVVSKLHGRAQRTVYVQATARDPLANITGRRLSVPVKEAIITLKTLFEPTEDRDQLIRILGNVVERAEVETNDDGFSQSVVTRAGTLGLKDTTPMPNPVELYARRSFRELNPMGSEYLIRFEGSGIIFFAEVDPEAWKDDVREAIHDYLADTLEVPAGFTIIR